MLTKREANLQAYQQLKLKIEQGIEFAVSIGSYYVTLDGLDIPDIQQLDIESWLDDHGYKSNVDATIVQVFWD